MWTGKLHCTTAWVWGSSDPDRSYKINHTFHSLARLTTKGAGGTTPVEQYVRSGGFDLLRVHRSSGRVLVFVPVAIV